ncbi:MAG TPA: AAA family ATPase, partial [Gemmataceae bacterium]
QTLKKNNLLTLHRGGERFDSLGGLDNLKDFCRRALQPGKSVKPRGILLLGVPGVGKSCFARALGNEVGRPTLLLDIGALYGSLLDELVEQAQRVVQGVAAQELRDNEALRQHMATQLAGVQSVLDGLLVDRPRRSLVRNRPNQGGQ